MTPRFRDLASPLDGDALHAGIEQDVERLSGLPVDGVGVGDDELVEERLVGEAAKRVVNAHVDRMAVPGQSEAVVKVGLGLFVLDVAGLDLRIEERQAASDPVLLSGEQVEWNGSGVVGLQELGPLVA